ncbi:hypothetical protein CRUP_032254, partial [Coryphaenoides rupestris]
VFRRLQDASGHFLLPVVFVTNAGSCLRHKKAQQLSDLLDIQSSLGFTNVITMDQLREQHPLLDMPIRWETNLQLLVDVLLTNGRPASPHCLHISPQLPVLACNTDLLWLADAPSPRLGHGMFMLCLEAVFWKLAGRKLRYE